MTRTLLARLLALALLGATAGASAQDATVTTRGGLRASSLPTPSSAPTPDAARATGSCPAPTGTRIAPRRDAQGRCPGTNQGIEPTRAYDHDQLESTGYDGDLGSALQKLDPSLNRR